MRDSPVLKALGESFRRSKAGRTTGAARDHLRDFKELLREAGSEHGDARVQAERDLQIARQLGLLELETHPKDRSIIYSVRLKLEKEPLFFSAIGCASPREERDALARSFGEFAGLELPAEWRERWSRYFEDLRAAAVNGQPVQPFSRADHAANRELAGVAAALLAWKGESLIRFASCNLCNDSKRLEQLRGKLETLMAAISGGEITTLGALGILETPRTCLLHGPVRFQFPNGEVNAGLLRGPLRISEVDITRAASVVTDATRCVTVENETTFHELAKLNGGDILVQTSYPGSGVLAFLERLPAGLEFFHFGDSDPSGFEILLELRKKTGRNINSLHMRFRPCPEAAALDPAERRAIERLLQNPLMSPEQAELSAMLSAGTRGKFEQETLGRPPLANFPYY